ncbi:hypothetical protein PFISCL1PPCAC_642, partial [Pristionchus fissidentatus]
VGLLVVGLLVVGLLVRGGLGPFTLILLDFLKTCISPSIAPTFCPGSSSSSSSSSSRVSSSSDKGATPWNAFTAGSAIASLSGADCCAVAVTARARRRK